MAQTETRLRALLEKEQKERRVLRIMNLWQDDPNLKQLPRLSVQPIKGGGMISLRGES